MSPTSLVKNIERTLRDRCSLAPTAPILVGLSGGSDSVALLLLLRETKHLVVAAHCNFHLRGNESNRDEQFCRELCAALGVELHVSHFDTNTEAKAKGESIEMAARRLRYNWFEQLRKTCGAEVVAVAHHRDDNVETLLLNLVRGTGIHGLTGMAYRRDHLIRPLLDVPHAALLAFLKAKGQTYVTDSTNADTRYKRNFVRHRLLPLLHELNPSVETTLVSVMHRLEVAEEAYDGAARTTLEQSTLTLGRHTRIDLTKMHYRAAFDLLGKRFGFTDDMVRHLYYWPNISERAKFESTDFVGVVRGTEMEICRRSPVFSPVKLPDEGDTTLPDGRQLSIRRLSRAALCDIPRNPQCVALDADCISGSLVYRALCEGDRFTPFGMKGQKTVSDYLTNRHVSAPRRLWSRVVVDDKGILWLAGERLDRRAAITSTTRRVIILDYNDPEPLYSSELS